MHKVFVLLFVTMATHHSLCENTDVGKDRVVNHDLPEEYFTTKPGDWYTLDYGRGEALLRREVVDIVDTHSAKEPTYTAVGFIHIVKDGKSEVHSYVGNEKGVKIIGNKVVDSIKDVDPKKLSEEFGWKFPK